MVVGMRPRTLSLDLSTQQPPDACKRAVHKNWSSAADMTTMLSDFLSSSGPAPSYLDKDTDGSVASDSTSETCGTDFAEGLQSAGEARSLFGSLFDSTSLEDAAEKPEPLARRYPSAAAPVDRREKKEVDAWTAEEDIHILKLVELHGKRWSKIAASLPGRSDNGVRNRWNRIERANAMREAKGPDAGGYRCRRCGLPKRGHTCSALTQGVRAEDLATRNAQLCRLSSSYGTGVQQQPESTPQLFKAAGNALIAVDRMEKQAARPPNFRLSLSPTLGVAPTRHTSGGTHGVTFADCKFAARQYSSTSSERGSIPDQPMPDRHTGLSSTFGTVDLAPTAAPPNTPLEGPAACELGEDHLNEFLMELHTSLASPSAHNGPNSAAYASGHSMHSPASMHVPFGHHGYMRPQPAFRSLPPAMVTHSIDHLDDEIAAAAIADTEFLARMFWVTD